MKKVTLKMLTEDTVNAKCSTAEQESLIAIYKHLLEALAPTLLRSAKTDKFCLTIECVKRNRQEQWVGSFRCGKKNLTIYAIIGNLPCATSKKEDSR